MKTTDPTEHLETHLHASGWTAKRPTVAGQGAGPLPAAALAEAVFLRLPSPPGRCPISGLCRSSLVMMLDDGRIKGVTIRKAGAQRGIRLILKQSLLDYLMNLAREQNGGGV